MGARCAFARNVARLDAVVPFVRIVSKWTGIAAFISDLLSAQDSADAAVGESLSIFRTTTYLRLLTSQVTSIDTPTPMDPENLNHSADNGVVPKETP